MDRAFDYGSKGWEFESLQARQLFEVRHGAAGAFPLDLTRKSNDF